MPVLSICSQVAWLLLVIELGFLCIHASRSCSELVPTESPLGRMLMYWSMYNHYPMPKEVLDYYCNTL